MKISIADFKDWYKNDPIWKDESVYLEKGGADGVVFDEETGEIILDDITIVDISDFGMMTFSDSTDDSFDAIELIKKYLASRDFDVIILKVAKKEASKILNLLKESGIEMEIENG